MCFRPTKVVQELLSSILGRFEVEEFLVLVDKLCVHCGVEKLVVGKHILEEGDVGLHKKHKERSSRGDL